MPCIVRLEHKGSDKECETRDKILRENECIILYIIGFIHLDWDEDKPYLYVCSWEFYGDKEYYKNMHACSKSFYNILEIL